MRRMTRRHENGWISTTECDEKGLLARLADYEDAMPLEQLQELSQAEKDGRLMVLPDAKYTDADGEKALQKAMFTCSNTNNPVTRYTADAIAEKLCREAKEENQTLTLEELRGMDGEPVWVHNFYNGWDNCRVVERATSDAIFFTDGTARGISAYGDGWLAYRRRPKE